MEEPTSSTSTESSVGDKLGNLSWVYIAIIFVSFLVALVGLFILVRWYKAKYGKAPAIDPEQAVPYTISKEDSNPPSYDLCVSPIPYSTTIKPDPRARRQQMLATYYLIT